jgi:aminomethyltransferase
MHGSFRVPMPLETGLSETITLPLDGFHQSLSARMVPFAGYSMPVQYRGIIAEHRWTRISASLFDVSHMGQLLLAGPNVVQALETLIPSDIQLLDDGRLRYSVLLNEEGGIIDDLIVTRRGEQLFVIVNAGTKAHDIEILEQRLRGIVMDHMREAALLALQGPKAVRALERVVPGVRGLAFMAAAAFTFENVPLWISRSGYTGEDGFEISLPASAAESFAQRLLDQPEVEPAGLGARDTLRLEAGLPLYGHDLSERVTPVEAGIEFVIGRRRRAEGRFPGASRLLKEIEEGPAIRRVGLAISGRQPVRESAAVIDGDGFQIGEVTSGGYSPTLETPIAMAYVPAALAVPETPLSLVQREKSFQAKVVPMPFVAHRYHRKESDRKDGGR